MKTYRVYYKDDSGYNQNGLLDAWHMRDVVEHMESLGFEPYKIETVEPKELHIQQATAYIKQLVRAADANGFDLDLTTGEDFGHAAEMYAHSYTEYDEINKALWDAFF